MTLKHKYMIVVPTTLGGKIAPIDRVDAARRTVKISFSTAFGGFTETKGLGGYVARDGNLIEEEVYQILAWADNRDDAIIHALARVIKRRLQQETVMYQIDGKVYIE